MNRPWKELLAPIFSLDEEASSSEVSSSEASNNKATGAPPETSPAERKKLIGRIHRSRENNPKLRSEKKKIHLKRNGRLSCEICRFDFERAYGRQGNDLIELHHTKPPGELSAGDKTRLSDLALVCPNCHTMLHRSEPCLTIEELKEIWRG